jgi:hypothetical protein
MALNNIEMVAQKMEGDNGPKVLVTVWADEADWLNVQIGDDAELGALLMDAVVDAIEGVVQ